MMLFLSVHVRSENINTADADFCFDFSNEMPMLLLIKKNDGMAMRLGKKPIECGFGYRLSIDHKINFTNVLDMTTVSFRGVYISSISSAGCSNCEIMLPPVIEPDSTLYMFLLEKPAHAEALRKNLLQFKNKIIDWHITVSVQCGYDPDVTYKFNFRAGITGECPLNF
jgi:hypothetical protein